LGGRGRQISEFQASLVYKVSSRTEKSCLEKPKKKKKKKEKLDVQIAMIKLAPVNLTCLVSRQWSKDNIATLWNP
jgi:hypothetical protein